MKGFAMLGAGKTGWIEKARPTCGALDAIVRPIAVSPCTSDVHTGCFTLNRQHAILDDE